MDALSKIKEHTDAIPLYTNFAAGWTMTAWDAYIDACATGQADFAHEGRVKGKIICRQRGPDRTLAVYNLLYEAVSRGLTEGRPHHYRLGRKQGSFKQGRDCLYGTGLMVYRPDEGLRQSMGMLCGIYAIPDYC